MLRFLFRNLSRAIRPGGLLFFSVKQGQGVGHDSIGRFGRFFRYWSETEVKAILSEAAPQLTILERWRSTPRFDTPGAS